MSTFSNAPWKATPSGNVKSDETGTVVYQNPDNPKRLADARLIAASPDLYAALLEITGRFESALGAVHATKTDRQVIKNARKALDRAVEAQP